MSLNEAKAPKSGVDYGLPEEGPAYARCVGLIDLGLQPIEFKGQAKNPAVKVSIIFELPFDTIEVPQEDGSTVTKPRWISKTITISTHEKSTLARIKKALGVKKLTDILNKPVVINIEYYEKTKTGETGASISSVAKLSIPPGVEFQMPEAAETRVFDFETPDQAVFDKLAAWQKEVISQALNVSELNGLINFDDVNVENNEQSNKGTAPAPKGPVPKPQPQPKQKPKVVEEDVDESEEEEVKPKQKPVTKPSSKSSAKPKPVQEDVAPWVEDNMF